MIGRMLRKDFLRKKLITIVVFAFIFLSALLVASGTNLIVELSNSLNALFTRANTPHFVQMHAGPLDQAEIDSWAAANDMVADQQTVKMITMDGSNLYLGESQNPEENSIMDISFVTQNEGFDFLLDLDNNIIQLSPGEIAVPVYYSQQRDLAIGDKVRVNTGAEDMVFAITAFSRDSQMNPAIASSKRFLIHEQDYANLREYIDETEYLIEFLLVDDSQISTFASAYQASDLPKIGPAVDQGLFRILNTLSDGLVAGVVILMSLLLIVIAILSLRFTLLATIEEDTREIGVMKAIGIARSDIRRIYLAKYVVMGAAAALLGYLTSLLLNQVLSANVLLYIGSASKSVLQTALPLVAASSIFLIVTISCVVILRRFNRISAVEALRSGSVGESMRSIPMLNLKRGRALNINAYLGVRDVLQRTRLYGLLAFVFFFCAVIIIIPIHFLTTIQSPTFISYMGTGQSDIRIDLRQSEDVADRFDSTVAYLTADPDVAKLSPLVTSQFTIMQSDGTLETLNIETGDFSLFPLDYVKGTVPQQENEIALSFLNAGEMEKQIGDTVTLVIEGQEREMVVSGIYQDITNGGRTAKATLPYNPQTVIWYTVNLNLASDANIEEKMLEYSQIFDPARVTDTASFVSQTVGNTVQQLKTVTVVTVVVGLALSVLITSLFMMMLITKDTNQIAIMRSLGFSLRHIRTQYLTRALFLLAFGIVLGTLFSNTLGQQLVSVVFSLQGASRIRFVIDPLQAYGIYPLLLMFTVAVTTILSTRSGIKETNIAQMIME
ncbi:MAG: ABC transporter permease [Anaerolineae bacterium SG8_19]|nr:MAG: ABC transporter permease [Anaerolineae bacterium SG8_19]